MDGKADNLKRAETRFQELKKLYLARSTAFFKLCSKRSKEQDRHVAFWEWHNTALDFFGSFDKVITIGALEKANHDATWFTEQGETAINLLDTIAMHYKTAEGKAVDLDLSCDLLKPSRTSFAATQRIARETNPTMVGECRDRFFLAGLPTHGFDTDEAEKAMATRLEPRFFYVGCVLLLFAVGMAMWAFSKGDLTADQRNILLWCLPLASGFGCWTFAGSLSAKAKGWQGITISAMGGFGVWFLTHFLLFR